MTDQQIDEEFDANGSIFGDDVDMDEIPDDPNFVPEGVYLCTVTSAVLAKTSKGDKVGLTLKYQIVKGEYEFAFPFMEWLWVPKIARGAKALPEEVRAQSRMMKHFVAYGIPKDEHKTVKPADLVGKFVKVRTKNRKGENDTTRINIVDVISADNDDVLTNDELAENGDDVSGSSIADDI